MAGNQLFPRSDHEIGAPRRPTMRFSLPVTRNARLLVAAMVVIATAFWCSMGATALAARQMVGDLPDRDSLGKVTEMARSSVFYDIKGRPAFTIFKEQRLETPLDRISPNLK